MADLKPCPECDRQRERVAALEAVAEAARKLRDNEGQRADAMDVGDETLYLRLLGEDSDNGIALDAALAALDPSPAPVDGTEKESER